MARTEEAAAAAGQPDTLQRLLEFAGGACECFMYPSSVDLVTF
jgi:hypothetical protein